MKLDGHKTQISAGLLIVAAVLYSLELIGVEAYLAVQGVLLGGAAYSLRDAIHKK